MAKNCDYRGISTQYGAPVVLLKKWVDFHYDVNGQTYDFSIQGGSCTSFRELVEALSITEEDPQVFVEDVESMVFSSPDLVSVSKVEEDTTAGAIKERLGLACEYSGELTEEEIAELDAKEVQAGDWALISLKAFNTEETLTVTMNTGEVFVIKVTDAQDPLGIDDRTLSFVYLPNSNSTSGYAVMSSKGNGNTLTSRNVSYTTKNGVEYCAKEASVWIFEYDADQETYYISNGYHSHEEEGMYLTFKNGNLDLVQGKENATPVKVERDNDGNYLIGDGNGGYLSYQNASFSRATNTNNAKFRFCLAEGSGSDSSHKATLTSAADLQPGQSIVIYQRVLQSDNTYLYYAIDGDGNAQKVWNSSDSVYWRGDISVEWEIVDAGSGYYYFYNPTTKTYLAPKGTGAIVVDLEDDNNPYDYGMDDVSLSLPGKKAGTYTSQIANWDYQRNVTDGLSITQSGGTTTVTSLLLPNSQEFYFAVRDPIVQGELTEVDTVDSISKGIKMTMYDFSGDYNYDYGVRLAYMNTVMGTPNWNAGVYRPNIASKTLGEDGYPVMTTGKSLGLVFEPPSNASNNYKSDPTYNVNHLFLQNIYDSTGFFRYSAFENFARLNTETGNFKVYEQIGTPSREGESDENAYYMQRGNFMPYNDLDLTAKKTNNIRPQDGQGLENANPRKGEELYRLKNRSNWDNLNYFFGMIMEAKFQQYPEGRNDRGDPVRYEFNGDDDMWIYIDGVLMLDLGGVHDALQGYIDFTNGNIHVYNDNNATTANTTIKQRFWEAHRFPDGEPWTDWNDSRVSEYFVGNTLKEYSTHDFKMFYMERGAGASNLEMQFNLLTILEDSFRVTKEMPKTINEQDVQGDYGNASFYYTAKKIVGGQETYCTKSEYEQTAVYNDGTPVIWKSETIFILKPGQTATFPVVDEKVRYYVEEVNPEQGVDQLSKFAVTNSDPSTSPAQDADKQYLTKTETVKKRGEVKYQNRPDDTIVNELQIKKVLDGELIRDEQGNLIPAAETNSPYFEYKVFMENNDGVMVPYSLGVYYQLDENGNFVYYTTDDRERHLAKFEKTNDGKYQYTYYTDGTETELGTTVDTSIGTNGVVTLDTPMYTEHTSENGSIGDVRPGDTIYIWGLLEGTDFVVDERIDRSNMVQGSEPEAGLYYFDGTTVVDAYVRPDINKPAHLLPGGIYEVPDYSGIDYKADRAAAGSIIPDKDAKVTVRNRSEDFKIELQKNWPATGFSFDDLSDNSKVTFTVKRYKLTNKYGTLNLTGILTAAAGENIPTNACPVYQFMQDGQIVKTVRYENMTPVEGSSNTRTEAVRLPAGTYTVACSGDLNGYNCTSTSSPVDTTVTVTVIEDSEEGQPETSTNPSSITFTSEYKQQTGKIIVRKVLTGEFADDTGFSATYTITRKGAKDPLTTVTLTRSDFNEDGIGQKEIIVPIGEYTIMEKINSTVPDGVVHSPESRTVHVPNDYVATAEFTADYPSGIPVVIHFGYSPTTYTNYQESTSQPFQFPAGSTISVPFHLQNCQYYSGHYQYWTEPAGQTGELTAYNASSSGTTDISQTFVIPENASRFDIYIKSYCDNESWTPSLSGIPTVQSRRSAPRMAAASKAISSPLRAASSLINISEIYNTVINPDTLPALNGQDAINKKYVLDTDWGMVVEMGRSTYTQTVTWNGTPSPDTKTGTLSADAWDAIFKHRSIVARDAEGNVYYYYIDAVSENQVPDGIAPDFDKNGTKTLVTSINDEHKLSVTNGLNGALQITKTVTVNGRENTTSLTDGTYKFTIEGVAETATAGISHEVQITFRNGKAVNYQIDSSEAVSVTGTNNSWSVLLKNLVQGDYVITETDGGNLDLVTVAGGKGDGSTNAKTVTVTVTDNAASTAAAQAAFTNNKDTGYIKLHKVVKYEGHDPSGTTQNQALAGTYTFKIYSDQGLNDLVGTYDITIGNDGQEKYSDPIELPVGTYWIEEEEVAGKPIYPMEANPREVSVTANDTSTSAKTFTVTNDYYVNSDEDTKTIDIEKRFEGLESEEDIPDGFQMVLQYTIPEEVGGVTQNVTKEIELRKDTHGLLTDKNNIIVKFEKDSTGLKWVWHLIDIPVDASDFKLKEEDYGKTGYVVSTSRLNRTESGTTSVDIEHPETYMPVNMTGPDQVVFNEVTNTKRYTADSNTSFWIDEGTVLLISLTKNAGTAVVSLTALNNIERAAITNSIPLPQGPFSKPVEFYSIEQHPTSITPDNGRRITVGEVNGRKFVKVPQNGSSQEAVFEVTYYGETTFNNEIITNTYTENVDLDIIKVTQDSLNEETKETLAGAVFRITKLSDTTTSAHIATEMKTENDKQVPVYQESSDETAADGMVTFRSLPSGYYLIEETQAPDGYLLLDEGLYVKIDRGVVSCLRRPDKTTDPAVLIKDWATTTTGNNFTFAPIDTNQSRAAFTVGNTPGAALPHTGGIGTIPFYLIGSMLIMFAAAVYGTQLYRRRRTASAKDTKYTSYYNNNSRRGGGGLL